MDEDHLQFLVDAPIQAANLLDPGSSEHASDVWRVQTTNEAVIVRRSRVKTLDYEFWWGCHFLFDIDPRQMDYFVANVQMLNTVGNIPAPRVLRRARRNGQDYLVVECMPGHPVQTFTGQSEALLRQLGTWLATVHRHQLDYFGNLARTQVIDPSQFHPRLALAVQRLVDREHGDHCKIWHYLDPILQTLATLPTPEYFCPIMVDLDPSQFLAERGILSAVVD